MAKSPVLLIVDVQRGFRNAWTGHIPAAVGALQAEYANVIATRFNNPPGSPYRKLIGWRRFQPASQDTELAFTPRADAVVIDKTSYTCIDAAFLARLETWGATSAASPQTTAS